MTVVLDNCEHVLGAAAEIAAHLLSGCPELRIVATSREPLGLDGEHQFALGPLVDEDAGVVRGAGQSRAAAFSG